MRYRQNTKGDILHGPLVTTDFRRIKLAMCSNAEEFPADERSDLSLYFSLLPNSYISNLNCFQSTEKRCIS